MKYFFSKKLKFRFNEAHYRAGVFVFARFEPSDLRTVQKLYKSLGKTTYFFFEFEIFRDQFRLSEKLSSISPLDYNEKVEMESSETFGFWVIPRLFSTIKQQGVFFQFERRFEFPIVPTFRSMEPPM